ncbi:ABC transporter ATP-binding protein [Francisella philomiragia]|uniref:ABC transporter ATP-binding protein n=1 Tax=Francisella philomiragia TaxID=28110 RepID=UPI00190748B8|nr:ABC transporter ATP-binding protein [Francisella philomiragia]MBK2093121.1 ABC transporter ATP-binding protein [Francisella philomiragia]MBK2256753.1 ABC transporter ATP-binding protein [Francisella philomiragia]MBK2269411.1 ABC transporter ATP-binding protein [Francisella philomiragia]MBK2271224.1 ABC transporter ATP-binding protein [Francisella philomiragia]MBK2275004.1 ABC transporter ATP-binding protein [Francisella philomiragia]
MKDLALQIKDLNVGFKTDDGIFSAVRDISFDLKKSHTLGIVGESGSGKSQTVLSLMGLLAGNAVVSGQALFHDQNLINMPVKNLNKIRGDKISMIFQDPMTSLNPYLTIHKQLLEPLTIHKGMSHKDATKKVLEMLDAVQIPDAKNRLKLYPHEFSGGMRQRVVIAMALLCSPEILIADEPTTALDVTVQGQILQLLSDLQKEFHMSMLFITHDLGVVAEICHDVMVMYCGNIMEQGTVDSIFANAQHPYTKGLLNTMPSITRDVDILQTIPGETPNIYNMPKGCPFVTRCDVAIDICRDTKPELTSYVDQRTACHFVKEYK